MTLSALPLCHDDRANINTQEAAEPPLASPHGIVCAARDLRRRGVCPGTPLTVFSAWGESRRRTELDIEDLRLIDYQLNDCPAGGFGFGVVATP